MKKRLQKEELIAMLVDYAANSISASEIATNMCGSYINEYDNDVKDILINFQNEWDTVEVDPEGPTKEQDAKLDSILDKYANELYEMTYTI